jgi:hypothetical protein
MVHPVDCGGMSVSPVSWVGDPSLRLKSIRPL